MLRFCVYDLLFFRDDHVLIAKDFYNFIEKKPLYSEKINYAHAIGFNDNINILKPINNLTNIEEIQQILQAWYQQKRDYQIDGIVFRFNDDILWESYGNTAHHQRGSLAFKQAGENCGNRNFSY